MSKRSASTGWRKETFGDRFEVMAATPMECRSSITLTSRSTRLRYPYSGTDGDGGPHRKFGDPTEMAEACPRDALLPLELGRVVGELPLAAAARPEVATLMDPPAAPKARRSSRSSTRAHGAVSLTTSRAARSPGMAPSTKCALPTDPGKTASPPWATSVGWSSITVSR